MSRSTASTYPIALTHTDRLRCVVIGGGAIATRKVAALLDAGSQVTVISPALDSELAAWRDDGRLTHIARPYESGDLGGASLAFAATDDSQVNAAVAAEARARGILINIADDPGASDFHTLPVIRSGDVQITVSTGGDSPALAALIRRRLESLIGPEYGVLAERLGSLRREIGHVLPPESRARLWRRLASDEALDRIRAGDQHGLEALIAAAIEKQRIENKEQSVLEDSQPHAASHR
jgi:precorrin-2 dehydrogenase / sirohydrochlorin ferrochelatase